MVINILLLLLSRPPPSPPLSPVLLLRSSSFPSSPLPHSYFPKRFTALPFMLKANVKYSNVSEKRTLKEEFLLFWFMRSDVQSIVPCSHHYGCRAM